MARAGGTAEKPVVAIPPGGSDRPAWSKVGVIAAVGFGVGVLWPRLAGVKVGPDVPSDARPAAVEAKAVASAPSAAKAAVAPAPGGSAGSEATAEPAAPSNKQRVTVSDGEIVKCFDAKNKKQETCDALAFDAIAKPRLLELAKCPAALGLEGKLPIAFEIDFEKKEVEVVRGKKTSLPTSTVNGVLACAGREFGSVALEALKHDHKKYVVAYTTSFVPPGKEVDEPTAEASPAAAKNGDDVAAEAAPAGLSSAIIAWDTALLRKHPKDGDVVARIVRGTKVKVVERREDWYRVESGAKSGWVYRGAIGL